MARGWGQPQVGAKTRRGGEKLGGHLGSRQIAAITRCDYAEWAAIGVTRKEGPKR